ncbi:MAG: TetR/AcrR family transcriptional regulator [Bacteroidales bacterium]
MPPRTREQFEEMRSARRLQIMDAALALFAKEGYSHCSISLLAQHTGISKGLMYHYFESKEQLLGAIIENGLDEIMKLLDPNSDGILQPEELEQFIRKVFSNMRTHREFWTLYVSVILQPGVKELMEGQPVFNYMERFFPLLHEYFKSKGSEDPYLEMLTLWALIEGFGVLMIYADPTLQFPDEILNKLENRIIDMFI